MTSILPNLLTLGNAICGFGAIVFTAGAASGWVPEKGLLYAFSDGKLEIACWLILAAMVFDALDGSVARMTRQTSNLGAQLDSLSDAITFTVAPAFLVWKIISLLPGSVVHIPQKVAWVLAVLYMSCGVLRLARFNVEDGGDEGHMSFSGLPTPVAAGVIASLTLLAMDLLLDAGPHYGWAPKYFFLLIPIIAFFLGVLMVSRISYPHLTKRLMKGRRPFHTLVQVIFGLAFFVLMPHFSISLSLIFVGFAVFGPINELRLRMAKKSGKSVPEPGTEIKEAVE